MQQIKSQAELATEASDALGPAYGMNIGQHLTLRRQKHIEARVQQRVSMPSVRPIARLLHRSGDCRAVSGLHCALFARLHSRSLWKRVRTPLQSDTENALDLSFGRRISTPRSSFVMPVPRAALVDQAGQTLSVC